jgi:hypothetical protein
MKIYFFPPYKENENGVNNPYCTNFKKELSVYGEIVNNKNTNKPKTIDHLNHLFDADVYIYNWVENIPFFKMGALQTVVFFFCLLVVRLRKKKIVWIFHNIVPHDKDNKLSRKIRTVMLKYSSVIITHSEDALMYLKQQCSTLVYFFHHPVSNSIKLDTEVVDSVKYDILIWGTILKYKGIKEFLQQLEEKNLLNMFRINIIGKCADEKYDEYLKQYRNAHINYENRIVSFEELNKLMKETRYVLFPYLPDSVSSSGALIDTIVMGGVPLGPNIGAFKDLNKENVCLNYTTYNELINILSEDRNIEPMAREKFINTNKWTTFAKNLYHNIIK